MKLTVRKAAEAIKKGGIVAFPTETVYGLGADAFNPEAVRKTFALKGRPSDNPLIVHISGLHQLDKLVKTKPNYFNKLTKSFWPGPLTIVLEKQPSVPDVVTGGLSTVAVRMPDHPLALDLIEQTGPLTAPSANKSGRPSPTSPEHLIHDYGDKIDYVDGGPCRIGLESTVVDLTDDQPIILRDGAITGKMIMKQCGIEVAESITQSSLDAPKSPGIKYTHYKPDAIVRWHSNSDKPSPNTVWLIHSNDIAEEGDQIIRFDGDFDRMARQLYDEFRRADLLGYNEIAIEPLPSPDHHPLISALENRISKAIHQ